MKTIVLSRGKREFYLINERTIGEAEWTPADEKELLSAGYASRGRHLEPTAKGLAKWKRFQVQELMRLVGGGVLGMDMRRSLVRAGLVGTNARMTELGCRAIVVFIEEYLER